MIHHQELHEILALVESKAELIDSCRGKEQAILGRTFAPQGRELNELELEVKASLEP